MNYFDWRANQIWKEKVEGKSKRVLLVEGVDDVNAVEAWLDTGAAASRWQDLPTGGWNMLWEVVDAGNKKSALAIAKRMPDWLALVDRDEWTDAEVGKYMAQNQNVVFLPRFCMESYLVDPSELWNALPQHFQAKTSQAGLARQVLADLQPWKRHAAIWQVVNPRWHGLRALGFNHELMKIDVVPDLQDAGLREKLKQWSAYMDDTKIYHEIQAELARIQTLPQLDFLRRHLYAKKFFPDVVCPALNALLSQGKSGSWRQSLFATMPVPDDLDPLWAKMGLM